LIAQSLLPEFDQEMKVTRRVLERVPFEHADYKPHEKSMDLRTLSSHIAEMTGWLTATIQSDSIDLAPVDGPKWEPLKAESADQLLSVFDANVIAARAALEGCPDDAMMATWSLKMGGNTMMSMPRVACIRGMIMNHIIHHRG
jgi:uncharacterized damage-inducible protein DinB